MPLSHTYKHSQYFVKIFLCPSLHGKMCFPPKHKLLCKLQPVIQEAAFLVANSTDPFGTSSEQTHQKKKRFWVSSEEANNLNSL